MEKIKNEILKAGRVTTEIREKYFPGKGFKEIRDTIEIMGLDRHMILELFSTEIAVKTPFGVLMQIRPNDNNQLGLWGGILEDGEEPIDGAVRELYEETGIRVEKSQLKFVEMQEKLHVYADNADQVWFKTYRYILQLDYVPEITTDEESVGAFMVVHTIISHQQDFIKRVLGEKDN